MSNRKWYEWMLTVVFIAMVGLCVFLNFTPGHKESMESIIVNGVMFAIVGITFLVVDFKCFGRMNSIIRDLDNAAVKIQKDAMNTHSYLWEPYQSGNVELFDNPELQEIFQDFVFELNRETDAQNAYYRSNIDEYINEDLIEKVMHRNELNQIAGMLTGLGILGTFIGLSLGLQSFNTGTTAEMTNSIEPLMDGIKVAFHTSIYGMVFSLVFNAVYKRKLYEAENAVDSFVAAFKKYVLPDTANDGMNQTLLLQERQLNAINSLSSRLGDELSDIMAPQFDRLQSTISDFANVATRNQTEALGKVVEVFIKEMNQSLSNTFWQINQSVEEQYQTQKQNALMMEDLLKATGSSTGNLNDINRETAKLITTLNDYSKSIQTIQNELQHTVTVLNHQNENSKDLLADEQKLLKEQGTIIDEFRESIDDLVKVNKDTSDQMSDALTDISDALDFMRRSLDKQALNNKNSRRLV